MQKTEELVQWLDHLRNLFPIHGIVHVGAGSGFVTGRYSEWQVPNALLVEADPGLYRKLAATVLGHDGWVARQALISDQPGERVFYFTTNPNESGVLDPEHLVFLWRNLKAREKQSLPANTLDEILRESALNESVNWIVIDCLPALPALRGVGARIESCDVVIARVLLPEDALPGAGATKVSVDEYLAAHGFRCVTCAEERQPAVATAVYVRNWKLGSISRSESEQVNSEGDHEIERLTSANGKANSRIVDFEGRIEQLAQQNKELEALAAERQAMIAELTKQCAGLEALAAERQAKIDELSTQKSNLEVIAGERQAKIAELSAQRTDLEAVAHERQAKVTELTRSVAQYVSEIETIKLQVERLTHEHDDAALLQALQLAEQKSALAQSSQAQSRAEKLAAERLEKIDEITKAFDKQAALLKERQLQIDQLNRACDEFLTQANTHQSELKEARTRIEVSEKLAADLQLRSAELAHALESRSAELAERALQIEHAATERVSMQSQIIDLKAQVDSLSAARSAMEGVANERQQQIEEKQRLLTQLQVTLDEKARDLVERVQQHEEMTKSREEVAKQLADVQGLLAQMTQAKAEVDRDIAAQLARQDELTKSLSQIEAVAEDLRGQMRQLVGERDELAQQLAISAEQVQQLSDAKAKAENAVGESQEKTAELAASLERQLQADATQRGRMEQLTRDHNEHARVSTERLSHIERLQAEIIAYLQQLQQLSSQNEESLRKISELEGQLTRVEAERAGLDSKLAESLARLEELKNALDVERVGAGERIALIERLTRDHDEHARVSRERMEHIAHLTREAETSAARAAQLEAERTELDFRQRLLDEELVKAEAQIELIKDVVLREKAF